MWDEVSWLWVFLIVRFGGGLCFCFSYVGYLCFFTLFFLRPNGNEKAYLYPLGVTWIIFIFVITPKTRGLRMGMVEFVDFILGIPEICLRTRR